MGEPRRTFCVGPVLAISRDGPTLKALQKIGRGQSRLFGMPPRLKSMASKANPVGVPQRARIGQPFGIGAGVATPAHASSHCPKQPVKCPEEAVNEKTQESLAKTENIWAILLNPLRRSVSFGVRDPPCGRPPMAEWAFHAATSRTTCLRCAVGMARAEVRHAAGHLKPSSVRAASRTKGQVVECGSITSK